MSHLIETDQPLPAIKIGQVWQCRDQHRKAIIRSFAGRLFTCMVYHSGDAEGTLNYHITLTRSGCIQADYGHTEYDLAILLYEQPG